MPKESNNELFNDSKKNITKYDNTNYKIFSLKNTRLYTDRIYNTAVIKNNLLIDEASFKINFEKKCFSKNENIVLKIGTPRFLKKIKGKVLSLLTGGGGNENYFHWVYDVLPRIGIYEEIFELKNLDFLLVPNDEKKFQIETLNLLNFTRDQILSSTKYRHIYPEELFVTQHPYCKKNFDEDELKIPLWISKWLRGKFIKKVDNKQKNLPKKFYIDRGDSIFSENRIIVNEEEIKEFLKRKGFLPIQLSKYNFIDQVKLFKDANHIIGLHGAGFSNIVFCSENTKVLEFRTDKTGKLYENIGIQNKLNFKKIEAKPINRDASVQQGKIFIDLRDIETLLS